MKKKDFLWSLLAIIVAATMSAGLSSCGDDDKDEVSVTPSSLTIEAKGGNQTVMVKSNTNWTVGGANDWCTVSPSSGSKDGMITVTIKANDQSSTRSNTLTIIAGDASTSISISQEPSTLSVTPTEITLLATEGSSANISISTTASWIASTTATWLHLSSASGEGATTLTVTALSDNASAENREANITFAIGSTSQTIKVSQRPKYINAYVDIDNILTLTTSVAFRQTYRGDVSYYYVAYLPKSSSAGWTDDKVVSTITTQFDPDSPEEGEDEELWSIDELSSNTTYYLFAVAFNEKGEQGPLQRYEITTPRVVSNRPRVTIGSITYSTNYWYWSTTIGPYAKRYYMVAYDDLMAYYCMYYYSDAMIAYWMKESIQGGDLTPIVNSGNWNYSRTSGAMYFYTAAWAQDDDGNMANQLDYRGGEISSSQNLVSSAAKKSSSLYHIGMKKFKENASKMMVLKVE